MFQNPEQVLLIASVILFLSIFAGKAGYRFGLPALLLFLGVGMLFGSDGLGIQFSDPNVAQFIGMLALRPPQRCMKKGCAWRNIWQKGRQSNEKIENRCFVWRLFPGV